MNENDPQIASANRDANQRIGANSINKVLYILEVTEPFNSKKSLLFSVLKMTETANYLDVVGFEISDKNTQKNTNQKFEIKTYQNALEIAERENNVVNIKFPWHRIINIKNVNYQHKKR